MAFYVEWTDLLTNIYVEICIIYWCIKLVIELTQKKRKIWKKLFLASLAKFLLFDKKYSY